jgi:hypothetical protein
MPAAGGKAVLRVHWPMSARAALSCT